VNVGELKRVFQAVQSVAICLDMISAVEVEGNEEREQAGEETAGTSSSSGHQKPHGKGVAVMEENKDGKKLKDPVDVEEEHLRRAAEITATDVLN
jgi:hypothetical protein